MSKQPNRSAAIALVIWLATQLGAIGICAGRVMLWSRAPRASEQLALTVLVAVQMATAALIFPYLLGTWRSALLAMVTALPLGQLAGIVSDAPLATIIQGEAYVVVWLVELSLFVPLIPTDQSKLIATALAAMITLGEPALYYFHLDFTIDSASVPHNSTNVVYGPLLGAISQTLPGPKGAQWGIVGLPLVVASTLLIVQRARRKI